MRSVRNDLYNAINLLNENDLSLIYEITQRILLTYDSDYTYVTPAENRRIQVGLNELENNNYMSFNDFMKENNL
jgi:hypothetical protein